MKIKTFTLIAMVALGTITLCAQVDESTAAGKYEADMQRKDSRIRQNIREGNERQLGVADGRYFNRYFPGLNSATRNSPRVFVRRLSKKDRELIAISPEDRAAYSGFLKQKNTGIVRLHDTEKCGGTNPAVVSVNCTWNVIGNAGAFSFRTKKRSDELFKDITFRNETFVVKGFSLLGFITDLGDISIDKMTGSINGVKQMIDFQPGESNAVLTKQIDAAESGFKIDDFAYSNVAPLKLNSTYAIRSIAFKDKRNEGVDNLMKLLHENDKRTDVVAVFRVVRKYDDGSVTIVWKRLQEKKAPEIRD